MKKTRQEVKSTHEKVGFALIEALEGSYARWQEKKSEGNRKRYLLWRLRLRLRFNDQPELLEKLNAETSIGLYDEEVGPLYDNVKQDIY
jgi:hypothetical protein